MSNKLDRSLKESIIGLYHAGQAGIGDDSITDIYIPEIKQLFIDDGWVPNLHAVDAPQMMAGKEWYDRFIKNLKDTIQSSGLSGTGRELLESLALMQIVQNAAKKASSINDPTKS